MMERDEHLAALERDGAAFVDACEGAGLATAVTSCGDWTVADLLWHVAGVYTFFGTIVGDRLTSIDGIAKGERPDDEHLAAACREAHGALVAALRATPDDTVVWTWVADRSVGFVRRRMAHETAVHRWDAERAAGREWAIDPALASDGIDEFLHLFVHRRSDDAALVGGSVHVHCGDVAGEWTLRPDPTTDAFSVTREHAKGDCAIRGAASDILLGLWRRLPLGSLDVVGDTDVAARFVAAPRL
jgi:uncharacterized protein (TIGR03083 family)